MDDRRNLQGRGTSKNVNTQTVSSNGIPIQVKWPENILRPPELLPNNGLNIKSEIDVENENENENEDETIWKIAEEKDFCPSLQFSLIFISLLVLFC